MKHILRSIEKKTGYPELLTVLQEKLSGSALNSWLLALFSKQVTRMSPAEVLRQYAQNRFTTPSSVDPIAFKELEIKWLKSASTIGFKAITLSPLTPLGTCAAVGKVSQQNVVSAIRGTEVVADATNVLALHIAGEYQKQKKQARYVTTHRHVRGQAFSNPGFTAHFGVFCLATGGKDTGNFTFELDNLLEHITLHWTLLTEVFDQEKLSLKFYLREENVYFRQQLEERLQHADILQNVSIQPAYDYGDYYRLVQFKIFLQHQGHDINLVDGGMVDWTQQLIPNKKHRLLISGSGLELIYKIIQGQV